MPNELPYCPLFVGDLMAAVSTWPPDRVGAYMLALLYQWENGGLPADDESELARILHASRSVARRLWLEIRSKFVKYTDGLWWNPKMEEVRIEARRQHKAASERGRKGAAKRWGKGAQVDAQASLKQSLGNANQIQSIEEPPQPPAGAGGSNRPRRRRKTDPHPEDLADIKRNHELMRLMRDEKLSRPEALKRLGIH